MKQDQFNSYTSAKDYRNPGGTAVLKQRCYGLLQHLSSWEYLLPFIGSFS